MTRFEKLKEAHSQVEDVNLDKLKIIAEIQEKLMENKINFMLVYDTDSVFWNTMWSFGDGLEERTPETKTIREKQYENYLEQICFSVFRGLQHKITGSYNICGCIFDNTIELFSEYVKKQLTFLKSFS